MALPVIRNRVLMLRSVCLSFIVLCSIDGDNSPNVSLFESVKVVYNNLVNGEKTL